MEITSELSDIYCLKPWLDIDECSIIYPRRETLQTRPTLTDLHRNKHHLFNDRRLNRGQMPWEPCSRHRHGRHQPSDRQTDKHRQTNRQTADTSPPNADTVSHFWRARAAHATAGRESDRRRRRSVGSDASAAMRRPVDPPGASADSRRQTTCFGSCRLDWRLQL